MRQTVSRLIRGDRHILIGVALIFRSILHGFRARDLARFAAYAATVLHQTVKDFLRVHARARLLQPVPRHTERRPPASPHRARQARSSASSSSLRIARPKSSSISWACFVLVRLLQNVPGIDVRAQRLRQLQGMLEAECIFPCFGSRAARLRTLMPMAAGEGSLSSGEIFPQDIIEEVAKRLG